MNSGTKAQSEEQTSNTSKIRSRSWFFTWNNPSENYEKLLTKYFDKLMKTKYAFQLECGEKGTLHVQGCCRFNNAVGTKFQKDLPKQIHWERCRSWKNAIKYCTKEETRVKGPWGNVIEKNDKSEEIKKNMEKITNLLEKEEKIHLDKRHKLYEDIQPLRGTYDYKLAFMQYREETEKLWNDWIKMWKTLSEKYIKLEKKLQ